MANQQASDVEVPQNVSNASHSTANQPKASASSDRLTPQAVAQQLRELDALGDSNETTSRVVNVVAGAFGAFGVVYLSRSKEHSGRLVIRPDHFTPPHLSHLRSLLQHWRGLQTSQLLKNRPRLAKRKAKTCSS